MPKFSYVARDINGSLYRGTIDAVDEKDVRSTLRQKGFYVTSVRAVREWGQIRLSKRVKNEEVAVFAEQLSVMVDAGLTLIRSLTAIAGQTKNEELRQIINSIKQDVENGVPFSESLGKYPKVFSSLFINMVKAGETGGVLGKSLRQVADYLDKEQQAKQKVKSALAYPKIVIIVCIAVVIFMVTFIVPRFTMLYNSMGVKLPLPTVILIGTSRLVLGFWWAMLIGVGAIVLAYKKFKNTNFGKEILDRFKLYMPVFGELNRKVASSRFVRVLSSLSASGVNLVQALEVCQQVVNNKVIDVLVEKVRASVGAGGGLKEPLSTSDIFPQMVVQMVAVGEETGSLGSALEKSADYLDREIDGIIKRLIARVEPAMTVVIGSIVGLILMAIYLPMFDIVKVLKR